MDSPIGWLAISTDDRCLYRLEFVDNTGVEGAKKGETTPLARVVQAQLNDYFSGKRARFDLPLRLEGTPFQQSVWAAMQTIPYGKTKSYGEIAAQIGNTKAVRAVGGACNKNPVAIIVPCHRIVAKEGLGGFAGGLGRKATLLDIEHNSPQNKDACGFKECYNTSKGDERELGI